LKVLITGASGQVGQALLRQAPEAVEIEATTHAQLDISNRGAVETWVGQIQPDVIINAAAYTAVDRAEDEPQQAAAINASGPENLARAALSIGACRLLHISTDYVFDGRAVRPYRPDDAPNPLSIYGRSKLDGEIAVTRLLGERAFVLRTAWVYAPAGKNFLLTMLRLMRERGSVRVVDDQHGTPTTADSIAEVLWAAAQRTNISGVWHWTDGGSDTWCGFARAIGEQAYRLRLLDSRPTVDGITTADYPTKAHRPANSRLDSSATIAALGLTPPSWRDNLLATLSIIANAQENPS
jgi:dTDP-4-dehydrorhamnose reductase